MLLIRSEKQPVSSYAVGRLLCEATDAYFRRRTRFGFVIDARGQPLPDARTRKLLGDYAKDREDMFARFVLADATVIDNVAVRGAITAVHWFAPPKHPMKVCSTVDEAISWAVQQLESAGLTVPRAPR